MNVVRGFFTPATNEAGIYGQGGHLLPLQAGERDVAGSGYEVGRKEFKIMLDRTYLWCYSIGKLMDSGIEPT